MCALSLLVAVAHAAEPAPTFTPHSAAPTGATTPSLATATTAPTAQTAPTAPTASTASAQTAARTVPPESNGFAGNLTPTRRKTAVRSASAALPYLPIRSTEDDSQVPEIEMFVGESRVFPTPGVARIAVGNGSLVTAQALDGKEVILFANGVGTSSLFLWNADGRYQRLKINIVPGDTTRYAREIAAFLSTIPQAKASVVGANIIVEGDDMSEFDLAKVDELAKRYPQIVNFTNRVGWEQMVAMDVKVVEFPVTALRQIGLNWSPAGGAAVGAIWAPGRYGNKGPYQANIVAGSGQNGLPIVSPDGQGTAVVVPSALNVLSALNLGLNAQLNLLAQEGKAALLAEPQLSARSGSKASFLAGGEIPYAVPTINGTYVQFKSYGVKLDITPRVGQHGVIRAAIQTEVSGIDPSVTTAGGPALLSRKTDTEFNVHAGETIVLSGLLQRETHDDITKVPLLGDVPILGALFRSKSYQNKETELVVFITPVLTDAQSPGVVDRIQRTDARLEQQMGPTPYLSSPVQPGVSYERPENLPPPPPQADAVPHGERDRDRDSGIAGQNDAAPVPRPVTAAPVRALPQSAPVPLPARPQVTAALTDSASTKAAVIASAAKAPRDITANVPTKNAGAAAQRYSVQLNGLALRLTPDLNAPIVAHLALGSTLTALPQPAQGGWTAVQLNNGNGNGGGSGSGAERGWTASEWLAPVVSETK